MFKVNEDKSIYLTRGDHIQLTLMASDGDDAYTFRQGDLVRFKVFEKKNCENVVLQKDFRLESDTTEVVITLEEEDTKIGEEISKPKDYWYEVEVNPEIQPTTIIGYDEDGAKIFKLFPEGGDLE
jgi:virulence-associated protein VagC